MELSMNNYDFIVSNRCIGPKTNVFVFHKMPIIFICVP